MAKVAINWFEIPASDLTRAADFYRAVLAAELAPMEVPDGEMLAFQQDGMPVGALTKGPHNAPSNAGVLVYFDGQGDLDAMLDRVAAAGGEVVLPKTAIGPYGHIAQFLDPEGNRIALHSG